LVHSGISAQCFSFFFQKKVHWGSQTRPYRQAERTTINPMLEQIDKINWKKLKHAYGSAADVPKLIRDLADPGERVRDGALYSLYGNIFHQGTRYEATPHAIPFLFELIEHESVRDKHKIIALLVNLALGYEEEYLPEGIDPEKFRNELREMEANMSRQERKNCEEFGYSARALIDCYDFVKQGIPVLWKCFESEDERVRIAAVYATSWFPEEADRSIPKIIDVLGQAGGEIEIANGVLALGLLNKRSEKKHALSLLEYHLGSDSELVRTCSAIALAESPVAEKALDILIEGLQAGERLHHEDGVPFNEGRISGYASAALSRYGKHEKEKVIPALCKAMESVNAYQALQITSAILSIINDQRTKPIKDEKLDNLNSLEIKALNSIHDHGGWTVGTGIFVNYSDLLRSAGIPDEKEELKKFLDGESG
jgi:hypothetical protein